jgi:hypothetical protein
MNTRLFLVSAGLLAMAATTASLATAGEHLRQDEPPQRSVRQHVEHHPARASRTVHGFDHGMQEVPTTTDAGQPGVGWRYFSNPQAHRAVVISPQGEYFLSRGKGLRLVAVTQPAS